MEGGVQGAYKIFMKTIPGLTILVHIRGDLFWVGCFKALSINKWFEVSDWSKLFVSALNLMGNKIDTKKKPK